MLCPTYRHRNNPSVVYVARVLGTGLIKIGSTRCVEVRIREHASWHRSNVEIIAVLPGGIPEEREVQRRFAAQRTGRRELFRDDGVIIAWAATLPPGNRGSHVHRCHGLATRGRARVRFGGFGAECHPASPSHDARHVSLPAHARVAPRGGCGALPHRDTGAARSAAVSHA